MEKEYKHDQSESSKVEEPMAAYGMDTEMDILPTLTEEERKHLITGEELLERVMPRIKKFFE